MGIRQYSFRGESLTRVITHNTKRVSQSIEAVSLWQFVIATTVVFPKVALHVFIGSRLAALSDGETRRQMDTRKSCRVTF